MNTRDHGTKHSPSKRRPVAAALFASLVVVSAAQGETYDFESLIPNLVLNGQDGWLSTPSLGEIIVRPDDTLAVGNQVAKPLVGVASGWPALLTRVNDENFGYSPPFGTETQVVLQFDSTGQAATGFALGRDVDGDGLLDWETGEVGPLFGTLRNDQQGVEQFMVTGAALQAVYVADLNAGGRCCNADSDWYRLQFRMDLSANSGAGSGSLYYKNLTRGDTSFQAVEELQNLDLTLGALHPDAGPDRWDAMWLATFFEGNQSTPAADNLVPRIPAVLGPDLTLSLQSVDAEVAVGADFDVELTPISVPSDPLGLYWALSQFAFAAPGAASAGTLQPNMDLILEDVDIQGGIPELGTIESVCLRYEGLLGEDESMAWSYDPLGCN